MAILGSREQLCVKNDVCATFSAVQHAHVLPAVPQVKKCVGHTAQNLACSNKRKHNQCGPYNNLRKLMDNGGNKFPLEEDSVQVPDIEDMVKQGKEMRVCPFYKQRYSLGQLISIPCAAA